ncbi:MAG: hypothetical protein ABIN94_19295 [Ferruginibacter sp.]
MNAGDYQSFQFMKTQTGAGYGRLLNLASGLGATPMKFFVKTRHRYRITSFTGRADVIYSTWFRFVKTQTEA